MLYITKHFTKTNTKIVLKTMLWNASINIKPVLGLYSDYQIFFETEDKA